MMEYNDEYGKKKGTFCRKWTNLERYIIFVCLALFAALISLIGVLIFYKHIDSRNVCLSPSCKREAGRILKNMDFSAKPCDDFYQFSCGSFLKYERLSEPQISTFTDMKEYILRYSKEVVEAVDETKEPEFVRKVKTFYQSCLNRQTDTKEIIKELLSKSKIKYWPFPKYGETNEGLLTLEEILSILMTHEPLFTFSNDGNEISLHSRREFMDEKMLLDTIQEEFINRKEKYRKLLAWTQFKVMGSQYNMDFEVDNIIDFHTALANLSFHARYENENYTVLTVSELELECPQIKWANLIKHVYQRFGHAEEIGNVDNRNVTIYNLEYFKQLCQLINHKGPEISYNFLVWSFFMEALFQMDSSFHESFREINPDKYYDPKFEFEFSSMKWKYCIDVMQKSATIQPGLSYLMIEQMQPKRHIEEVTNYVENIKEVMDHTFEKAEWLSEHVKEVLRKKLHRIPSVIGFSSESEDVSTLKEHFTKIRVSDNFVENWIRNSDNIFSYDFFRDMLLMQVNMSMKDPMSFEAINTGNRIEVPLGTFVPPTYTPDVPKYLNYGAMGFIIAHEISHTFDFLDPSLFNTSKEGVKEALHTFELKNQCYIDQYSKFPVDDESGIMIKGRMTYPDNNADNSGIIHAFLAYRNYLEKNGKEEALPALQYTNLQMFFIRFAQLFCEILESPLESYKDNGHSPGKYRALIPLMNFPMFSQQFQCPIGSRMNPENKCLKWS